MRQAFVLGCALLICICIAGDAQPLVAQDNGQIHAGTCRSEKCPCTVEQKDNGMLDTEVGCISSCQNERKSMFDQGSSLASLGAEYKRNHHPTLEKLISKEFQALEKRWNALKKSCPSIGSFPWPGAGYNDAPIESDPLGNGLVGAIGGAVVEGGMAGAGGGVIDKLFADDLHEAVQGGVSGVAVEVGAKLSEPLEKPGGTGDDSKNREMLRTGNRMVKTRASEVTAVNNYFKANQGYRAAMVAKDSAAIDANLHTALAALVTAKEQARQAVAARSQLELQLQKVTDQGIANLQKNGGSVQDALSQFQNGVKQHGLPPELVSKLQADGVPAARISELRQRVESITPAQYEAAIQTRRDRLQVTQAMNEKLASIKSGATWPEPPEIGQLEVLEQQTLAQLQKGVRLEMAQNMGPLWQWWLVSLSKPDQAVQRQNGDQRTMVVPPGEYQVAMQPTEYNSQPVVWPQKIQVQVGQQATFKVSSGVRMIGPSGASPDFEFQFLNDKKQIAQTGRQTWSTQVLPPGTYSLQIEHQFGQWRTVAEQVQVIEGQITEVRISELPHQ